MPICCLILYGQKVVTVIQNLLPEEQRPNSAVVHGSCISGVSSLFFAGIREVFRTVLVPRLSDAAYLRSQIRQISKERIKGLMHGCASI